MLRCPFLFTDGLLVNPRRNVRIRVAKQLLGYLDVDFDRAEQRCNGSNAGNGINPSTVSVSSGRMSEYVYFLLHEKPGVVCDRRLCKYWNRPQLSWLIRRDHRTQRTVRLHYLHRSDNGVTNCGADCS